MATPEAGNESSPAGAEAAGGNAPTALETVQYNDGIVRQFSLATLLWGLAATLVGLWAAVMLVVPRMSEGAEWMSFGRIRPVHTNTALLAFVGNAVFAAIYYSTQRLCKARLWSGVLGSLHFWAWQLILLVGAVTLPLGATQGKEYAELEWPFDVAILLVWLVFAVNFFMTLARRRERHLYVSLWFYIATVLTFGLIHLVNGIVLPAGLLKSFPIYAGVHDAFMQWWYGHNLIGFLLLMPFLGLMYYFLPKALDRPIYSYKLSVLHFWSLAVLYVWAGPHQLHYTPLPEWLSTLGMVFGVLLWMPLWGGAINGLMTFRGARDRLAADPVPQFFLVGVVFYGLATLETSLMSIKTVQGFVQFTDLTIGHLHAITLGWNGMMTFGMLYWLLPRLFQTPLWSARLARWHFWVATAGVLLYLVPIYAVGAYQAYIWRALDDTGRLVEPEFIDTVRESVPFWWARAAGGALFIAGIVLAAVNWMMTWRARPEAYEETAPAAPSRGDRERSAIEAAGEAPSRLADAPVLELAKKFDVWSRIGWHRRWELSATRFALLVGLAVVVGSLFEMVPLFLIRSNVPPVATVQPYTPLELAGRDIYLAEGCVHCHSQVVRPLVAETRRFGEFSRAGEFIHDRPHQWGTRRIGPDLARESDRQSNFWHWLHFEDPRQTTRGSVMPSFAHLLRQTIDFDTIPERVETAHQLGAPYTPEELENAEQDARIQGMRIAAEIVQQGGPIETHETKAVALIAYIQRLGADWFRTPDEGETADEEAAADEDEAAAAETEAPEGEETGEPQGQEESAGDAGQPAEAAAAAEESGDA